MRKIVVVGAAAAICMMSASPSLAGNGFLGGVKIGRNADRWEVRGGASAYDTGVLSSQKLDGFNLNAEVLAPSPAFLARLGAPRPYIGTDIAISDNPIDMFYGGLNWEAYFTKRFYLGFSLGGAVATKQRVTNDRGYTKNLGSQILFHLQASAGYDISKNVTLQVYYNHFSNARLAEPDPGLESVGGRIGYRF